MKDLSYNIKRSAVDAHAAIRNFTAKRCCSGAQSGTRPSKSEEMRRLKGSCPLCFTYRKESQMEKAGILHSKHDRLLLFKRKSEVIFVYIFLVIFFYSRDAFE